MIGSRPVNRHDFRSILCFEIINFVTVGCEKPLALVDGFSIEITIAATI